jgi:hypothetical protein
VLRRILGLLCTLGLVPACSAGEEPAGTARVRDTSAAGARDADFTTPVARPAPGSGQLPEGSAGGGELFPGDVTAVAPGTPLLTGAPFGCPTSLSGTVFDPAGRLPLYNVVVYVPSEALAPIREGAACDTCDGNFSGRPIAATASDAAGHFTLALDDVPKTADLPLVVQVGKWRRQLVVPGLAACSNNSAPEGSVRLPRDRSEGSLPHIAVVRGASDALECLFRKIGISPSEFSSDTGGGSVHLYASADGTAEAGTTRFDDGSAIALPAALFASLDRLLSYDALFLACEGGGRGTFDKYGAPEFSNLQTYADRGGRIFGSHYQNYWIRPDKFDPPRAPYPEVVKFASSQHGFDEPVVGQVNASFPKGAALRDWLGNVGASPTPGSLQILDGEHTVDSVLPGKATPWITVDDPSGHSGVVQYFSFTAPVGAAECGRMVFSDLHVASGTGDSGKRPFPSSCVSQDLSPQEKALTFMLFDLSSCVQPELAPVVPPIIIR